MSKNIVHPDINDVELTAVMYALSDPVRLAIVRMAANSDKPLPCNAFTDAIAKSTLSHHWRVLRECGLLCQEPVGSSKLNYLRKEELDERFPGLLDAVLMAKTSG